jgi:hypothetical protein
VVPRASLNIGKEKEKNILPLSAVELRCHGCQLYSSCYVVELSLIVCTYCIITCFLTPLNRVLEKLTSLQLVKKFPAFNGTRRFITIPPHLTS